MGKEKKISSSQSLQDAPASSFISNDDSPSRVPVEPCSPLPPLNIEAIPKSNPHDEPEEFYKELEVKMKKFYRKIFYKEKFSPDDDVHDLSYYMDGYESDTNVVDNLEKEKQAFEAVVRRRANVLEDESNDNYNNQFIKTTKEEKVIQDKKSEDSSDYSVEFQHITCKAEVHREDTDTDEVIVYDEEKSPILKCTLRNKVPAAREKTIVKKLFHLDDDVSLDGENRTSFISKDDSPSPVPVEPCSPLPPLHIEEIPKSNPHGKPEEFYKELGVKMEKLYKKLYYKEKFSLNDDVNDNVVDNLDKKNQAFEAVVRRRANVLGDESNDNYNNQFLRTSKQKEVTQASFISKDDSPSPVPVEPCSPLPPLHIEEIPKSNPHGKPEEFYKELGVKMEKLYKKLYYKEKISLNDDVNDNVVDNLDKKNQAFEAVVRRRANVLGDESNDNYNNQFLRTSKEKEATQASSFISKDDSPSPVPVEPCSPLPPLHIEEIPKSNPHSKLENFYKELGVKMEKLYRKLYYNEKFSRNDDVNDVDNLEKEKQAFEAVVRRRANVLGDESNDNYNNQFIKTTKEEKVTHDKKSEDSSDDSVEFQHITCKAEVHREDTATDEVIVHDEEKSPILKYTLRSKVPAAREKTIVKKLFHLDDDVSLDGENRRSIPKNRYLGEISDNYSSDESRVDKTKRKVLTPATSTRKSRMSITQSDLDNYSSDESRVDKTKRKVLTPATSTRKSRMSITQSDLDNYSSSVDKTKRKVLTPATSTRKSRMSITQSDLDEASSHYLKPDRMSSNARGTKRTHIELPKNSKIKKS